MNWLYFVISLFLNLGVFTIISFWLKGLIQKSLDKDLEKFKSELLVSATEHQIRYAKLHDYRAEVIRLTFANLVCMERSVRSYMNLFQQGSSKEDVEKRQKEKGKKAAEDINKFIRYYSENEILFTDDICQNMKKLIDIIKNIWNVYDIMIMNAPMGTPTTGSWKKVDNAINSDVPMIKEQLIGQMRVILGVKNE